jgi:hypothetical protein
MIIQKWKTEKRTQITHFLIISFYASPLEGHASDFEGMASEIRISNQQTS